MIDATPVLELVHSQLERLMFDQSLTPWQAGRAFQIDRKVTDRYAGTCDQGVFNSLSNDVARLGALPSIGDFAAIARNTEAHVDQVTPP
jgi:NAD-specific glutamate dehydrogenase